MEHFSDNREFDLYRDINTRTNGEIYIGVVGPVRTGKSTFIKRFMDLMVLPFMEDEHARERTIDELPQSAAGKTIMTTEPKFIPQEAAEIILPELPGSSAGMPQPALSQSVLPGTAIQGSAAQPKIKVRLIDCVGFMVEGASGHMEGNESRMVKTPWSEQEIPLSKRIKRRSVCCRESLRSALTAPPGLWISWRRSVSSGKKRVPSPVRY